MSRIVLLYSESQLVYKNNLAKEARAALHKYDLRILPSEQEYNHMISLLQQDLQRLNEKHNRCQPLQLRSWRLSDMEGRLKNIWNIEHVGQIKVYSENTDNWE